MSKSVIDALEMIQVDHEADHPLPPLVGPPLLPHVSVHVATVVQANKWIGLGEGNQMADPVFYFGPFIAHGV